MRPPVRSILAAVLALAATLALPPLARAALPDDAVMDSLNRASLDTLQAASAEARLRRIVLDVPPPVVPMIRHLVVQCMVTERAPTAEILAVADSVLADRTLEDRGRAMFSNLVVGALLERKQRLGWADTTAHALVRTAVQPGDWTGAAQAVDLLARVFEAAGRLDSAIAVLTPAVAAHPNLDWLSADLGYVCEWAGHDDDAIRHYLHADALAWSDTTISAGLRRVWVRRHGALAGLAPRVARARREVRHDAIFVGPRVTGRAPEWSLPALTGGRRGSADLAGRVTVLEFWGTWCPPCVEHFPHFVALSHEARWRGVAFLAVDCENAGSGPDPRGRVGALVREKGWRVAVAQDTTMVVAERFGVPVFPCTVVIDRAGRLRFRDFGLAHDAATVREQLALLLREPAPAKR